MSDERDFSGLRPETLAAQALHYVESGSGAIVPPIQPATTYRRGEGYARPPLTDYTRGHNPTYEPVESTLAKLEGGSAALVLASGLAASAAIVMALDPGDHVIVHDTAYWGFRAWLEDYCRRWGLGLDSVDLTDLDAVAGCANPRTRLIWAETPSNPLLQVLDIAALAEIAKGVGARLVVDSTTATPVLTRPLELGADLVMHSATKYLNGHSDVLAGAVATAREDDFWARLHANRTQVGAVLGPFEAWLLLRGLRTLYLRVERACASALYLARELERHPKIEAVLYPGLESHAGHALAVRQMQGGFGGMMSIRVKGGEAAALAVVEACQVFLPATSLGGVESLVEHRATIEGTASPLPRDLLRLSIGIEHPEDLLEDLTRALAAI
jgi:cystathionine gamma-synthase